MDISYLNGKTIIKVEERLNGLNILFSDGSKITLSQNRFPDGSYDDTYINKCDNTEDKRIDDGTNSTEFCKKCKKDTIHYRKKDNGRDYCSICHTNRTYGCGTCGAHFKTREDLEDHFEHHRDIDNKRG